MSYFILTDTSANLPTPVCEEWELERMPFAYILDGKEYTCMDTENFDDKEYYGNCAPASGPPPPWWRRRLIMKP